MQGSARKDVVFGAARVYTVAVLGTKWKSWDEGLAAHCHPGAFRHRPDLQACHQPGREFHRCGARGLRGGQQTGRTQA